MPYVMFNSVKDIEDFRDHRRKVEDHFESYTLAEAYLNGLIDWNGNEICDYCPGECNCGDFYYP